MVGVIHKNMGPIPQNTLNFALPRNFIGEEEEHVSQFSVDLVSLLIDKGCHFSIKNSMK